MDALSRFWCEIIRLKYLLGDALDDDIASIDRFVPIDFPSRFRGNRDADADLDERWKRLLEVDLRYEFLLDWVLNPGDHHYHDPQGIRVADLLAGEADGLALPQIEELARVAILERTSDRQENLIIGALAALKGAADWYGDGGFREYCECKACEKRCGPRPVEGYSVPMTWYGIMHHGWEDAIKELGFYVPPEYKDYEYEGWKSLPTGCRDESQVPTGKPPIATPAGTIDRKGAAKLAGLEPDTLSNKMTKARTNGRAAPRKLPGSSTYDYAQMKEFIEREIPGKAGTLPAAWPPAE